MTTERAHLLFEALQMLGWSDAAEIAKFVRRLERGLPAEDELSVLLHWLGRCKLVHKLDQVPYPPGVWKHYRVPDLLAVFDAGGTAVPVLIEVKSTVRLSWTPEYLEALQAYAAMIGLPLLVAWKHRTFWALFEAVHLRKATKNFSISFSDAMSESLLCLLAGDFSFSFQAGVGVHLKIRKNREMEKGFWGEVEEAFLLNAEGKRHSGAGGILQLFSCIDQEVILTKDKTHARQSFVIQEEQQAEFAHRALVNLLDTFGKTPGSSSWRQILIKGQGSPIAIPPQKAARNALDAGFLRHVIHIRPKTSTAFMRRIAQHFSAADELRPPLTL